MEEKKAKIEHQFPKIKEKFEFAAQRAKSLSWKILQNTIDTKESYQFWEVQLIPVKQNTNIQEEWRSHCKGYMVNAESFKNKY